MKLCPSCHLRYPADAVHCFVDRAVLVAAPDPFIGSLVAGRYRIEEIIGAGGMATVYRARGNLQDRAVAVKLFRKELATDPRLNERFRREARSTRRLAHRNIIEIIDDGDTDDGTPFLVMELLRGETLEAILKRKGAALELARAIDLNLQVLNGLARAHDFQVLHRDLKPDNLFVLRRDDGTELVKILDFGIARCMQDTRLTGSGEIFGTPQYMAPERITSIDAGPSADLYAVGCILFRCVTGRLPFLARDVTNYLIQHLREPPPSPRAINPEVPPELDALILQCLEKDPTRRPVDAHAIERALARIAEAKPRTRYFSGAYQAPAPGELEGPTHVTLPSPELAPASLERWQRRIAVFIAMVARAFPAGAPARLAAMLASARASVDAMAGLQSRSLEDQRALDDIAARTRDAQARFGRAMDALGHDLSRARQQALEARALEQRHLYAPKDPSRFVALHGRLAAAPAVPSSELLTLYRAATEALERLLQETAASGQVRAVAEQREVEVRDIEFQIDALRAQLARLSQASEDETQQLQQRLGAAGEQLVALEQSLVHDAGALANALRGHAELRDLFAQLEAA